MSEPHAARNALTRPNHFADRVTAVLHREPAHYSLLLHMKAARAVGAVADSLALDADPAVTGTAYALFRELVDEAPAEPVPQWLERMCNVARTYFGSLLSQPAHNATEEIARHIYADEKLLRLIAAEEVGTGTVAVIESLALDGNVEDSGPMLALMHELAADAA